MQDVEMSWRSPPQRATLAPTDVHIWRVFVDDQVSKIDPLRRTLADDELERADRFRFDKHRHWYIVRRGMMRNVLARYLDAKPAELSFCYGARGKPALGGAHEGHELQFNLSDSAGLAVLAVTRGRAVGIDVEHLDRNADDQGLARRFFAPEEVAELTALPPSQRRAGFFNCWTRKEAYIKAHGHGLLMALDRFAVSLTPGKPAVLRRCAEGPQELARWSMLDLPPAQGFAGCLIVEGSGSRLRCWDWLG